MLPLRLIKKKIWKNLRYFFLDCIMWFGHFWYLFEINIFEILQQIPAKQNRPRCVQSSSREGSGEGQLSTCSQVESTGVLQNGQSQLLVSKSMYSFVKSRYCKCKKYMLKKRIRCFEYSELYRLQTYMGTMYLWLSQITVIHILTVESTPLTLILFYLVIYCTWFC